MVWGGSAVIPAPGLVTPFVRPGTAGYLGDLGALTPYAPPASGFPGAGQAPPGWTWTAAGLRNDTSPEALDHVHVYGGLYTAGNVITVTQSVIQAGTGSEIACIQHHGAAATGGGQLTAHDCTLGWLPGQAPPSGDDVACIFDVNGPLYDVQRCDLSGTPQGLNPPGSNIYGTPSLVLRNWIHGLVQNKPGPTPNHMDGIFCQGGAYLIIQGNYVDAPAESSPGAGDVTACLFFQDQSPPFQIPRVLPYMPPGRRRPGRGTWGGVQAPASLPVTDPGIIVDSNYLSGGGSTFYNQSAAGITVSNNLFSGIFKFGDALNQAPGTIGAWLNNVHPDGTAVPHP